MSLSFGWLCQRRLLQSGACYTWSRGQNPTLSRFYVTMLTHSMNLRTTQQLDGVAHRWIRTLLFPGWTSKFCIACRDSLECQHFVCVTECHPATQKIARYGLIRIPYAAASPSIIFCAILRFFFPVQIEGPSSDPSRVNQSCMSV